MADTGDLKSPDREVVRVRSPPRVHGENLNCTLFCHHFGILPMFLLFFGSFFGNECSRTIVPLMSKATAVHIYDTAFPNARRNALACSRD